ncbi:MAG: hypothetical protein WAU02_04240 [Candidatus Saccharimonadales bacterium]
MPEINESFPEQQLAFQNRCADNLASVLTLDRYTGDDPDKDKEKQINGITDWVSIAAASSESPISLAERIRLANAGVCENGEYGAKNLAHIRAVGKQILGLSVRI